jgi:hypothetical protein
VGGVHPAAPLECAREAELDSDMAGLLESA